MQNEIDQGSRDELLSLTGFFEEEKKLSLVTLFSNGCQGVETKA